MGSLQLINHVNHVLRTLLRQRFNLNLNYKGAATVENPENNAAHEEIEFEPYTVLPAGMYRCRLEAISNLETQYGTALKFHWKVSDGEVAGEEITALCNKKLLPKSKLATWAKAHLNVPSFPDGFVLKLGQLIGRDIFLTLGVEPRADGMGERNVVRAVDPVRPATAKKAKDAKKAEADDFSEMLSGQGIPDAGEPVRPPDLRLGRVRSSDEVGE
jgi:hypothetical protein